MAEARRPSYPSVPIDIGDGPAVVLVHGQPGSGGDWADLARELARDHRVIAPDRPGWGSHPRPAAGLGENADALYRVIEGCGAATPVTLVGHSLGGGIALELALERPEVVAALVLVGSVGTAAAVNSLDRVLAMPMVGDGLVAAGSAALARGLRALRGLPGGLKQSSVVKGALRLPTLQGLLEGSPGEPMTGRARASFMTEQRALVRETPALESRLSHLQVPVAVVSGTVDHIVPPSASRRLAELIPGAELVMMKGSGHLLAFEHPAELAAVIRRYSRMGPVAPARVKGEQPPPASLEA